MKRDKYKLGVSRIYEAIVSGEGLHYTVKKEIKRTIIHRGKEVVDCRWFDYERDSVSIDCSFVREGSFERCEDCPCNV